MSRSPMNVRALSRTLGLLVVAAASAAPITAAAPPTVAAGRPHAASAAASPSARGDRRAADPLDQRQLAGLQWRNIGPFRGGRVTAATGVVGARNVYYFGGTGG